ncbi:uncharacterized protein LOC142349212 [Convolutriloba macropyga]|uniref:uncharacterized protein LOC142349212 n=1 Tax=Convolutriloba macropyga TaxID=536237 RepID=UPI003F520847
MAAQLISMKGPDSSQGSTCEVVNSNKLLVVSNCDNAIKNFPNNTSLDDQVMWRMSNYDSSDDERLERLLRPESPKDCTEKVVEKPNRRKSSDYLDQLLANGSIKSNFMNTRCELGGGDCRLSDDEKIVNSKESCQEGKSCDDDDSVVNNNESSKNSRVFFRSPPKADGVGESRHRELSDEESECEGIDDNEGCALEQVDTRSESFGSIKVSIKSENVSSTCVRTVEVTRSECYRESNEAKTASAFEDPGSDSSSESDSEFYRKLRTSHIRLKEDVKVHPNYPGPTVPKEVVITELPEIEELKDLTLEDDAYMQIVGHVMSVVGVLAIIKSANEAMALDADTVLFNEDKTVFGKVFEVFGPVREPFYTVRFNNEADVISKGVKVGLSVYCCLSDFDMTKVVFQSDLEQVKGSDASWRDDLEPPEFALQYSDDEAEREAKRALALKRRQKREEAEELNDDGVEELNSSSDASESEGDKQSKKKEKSKSEKQSKVNPQESSERKKISSVPSKMSRPMGMSFANSQENQTISDENENDECEEVNEKFQKSKKHLRQNKFRDKTRKPVAKVGYIEPIDVLYVKELNKQANPRKVFPGPPTPPVRDWMRSPSRTPRNSSVSYQGQDNRGPEPVFNNPFESTATWNRPYNPHNASFAQRPGSAKSSTPRSSGNPVSSGQRFQHSEQINTRLPTDPRQQSLELQEAPFQRLPSQLAPLPNGVPVSSQNVATPQNLSLPPQNFGFSSNNGSFLPQNSCLPVLNATVSPHRVSFSPQNAAAQAQNEQVTSRNVVTGLISPGVVSNQQQTVPMRTIVIQVPADQLLPEQLVPFQQLPQTGAIQGQCLQQLPQSHVLSPPPVGQVPRAVIQPCFPGQLTSNVQTSSHEIPSSHVNSSEFDTVGQLQPQMVPRPSNQHVSGLPPSNPMDVGVLRPPVFGSNIATPGNSVTFQAPSLNIEFGRNPNFPTQAVSFSTSANTVSNVNSAIGNFAPRMTSPFFTASSVMANSQQRPLFSQPVRFVTES